MRQSRPWLSHFAILRQYCKRRFSSLDSYTHHIEGTSGDYGSRADCSGSSKSSETPSSDTSGRIGFQPLWGLAADQDLAPASGRPAAFPAGWRSFLEFKYPSPTDQADTLDHFPIPIRFLADSSLLGSRWKVEEVQMFGPANYLRKIRKLTLFCARYWPSHPRWG